ncbi:MAG: hypothetical protein U0821_05980 [Chloroflexota bacterium]
MWWGYRACVYTDGVTMLPAVYAGAEWTDVRRPFECGWRATSTERWVVVLAAEVLGIGSFLMGELPGDVDVVLRG